jgi:hypothetical protein
MSSGSDIRDNERTDLLADCMFPLTDSTTFPSALLTAG